MNEFIVVRVVKHAVSDTVLVDEVRDLPLFQDDFNYLFELLFHLGSYTVDVDEEVLVLEVGAGEAEEEAAEGKVHSGLVKVVEEIDEATVALYLAFVLIVLVHVPFARVQDLLAQRLRLVHQGLQVLIVVHPVVLCQPFVVLQNQQFLVRLAQGLLQRHQRHILLLKHPLLLLHQILVFIDVVVLLPLEVLILVLDPIIAVLFQIS